MAVKVSSAKENENRVSFELDGVSIEFANMLRRYCISSVPVFAITAVTFYDNTSSLFDEYLAHRLALLPILTPAKAPKESEIVFTLDEHGPKVVYSGDLKSSDKEISMAKDKIPIITLTEKQSLRFEGKAVLGTAKTHANFQSGIASYEEKDEKFDFKAESCFQMSGKELILRACDSIEDDLKELQKVIKKA